MERLGLLQAYERFEKTVYEGAPLVLFAGNQSLPPPVEKPKPKAEDTMPATEWRAGPSGKLRPQITAEAVARVKALLAEGVSQSRIASMVCVSTTVVRRISHSMSDEEVFTAIARTEAPPTPAPSVSTPRVSEPVRTDVLDWQRRMAGWSFEGAPYRKVSLRIKVFTHDQAKIAMGKYYPSAPITINSKPKQVNPFIR
jgi:transposase